MLINDLQKIKKYFESNILDEIQIVTIKSSKNSYLICRSILYEIIIVKQTNKIKLIDILQDLSTEYTRLNNEQLNFKILDYTFYYFQDNESKILIPKNNCLEKLIIEI